MVRPTHAAGWTPERVDLLKKLWIEGLSAGQIAKQLTGVTRAAVIGKARRVKCAPRAATQPKPPKKFAEPHVIFVPKSPKPSALLAAHTALAEAKPNIATQEKRRILAMPPLADEQGRTATIYTLDKRTCSFPIGDPGDADFAFCGRGIARGAYCVDHARISYIPNQKRERKAHETSSRRLRSI